MAAKVYFAALADDSGTELSESDGTVAGTGEVGGPPFNSGIYDANANGLDPLGFATLGDGIVFDGKDNYNATASDPGGIYSLWVTNGTAAGTYEVGGEGNQGVVDSYLGFTPIDNLIGFGSRALFLGWNAEKQDVLWVTDGTTSGTVEIGGSGNAGIADKSATGSEF